MPIIIFEEDNSDDETQKLHGRMRPLTLSDRETTFEIGRGAPEAVKRVGAL